MPRPILVQIVGDESDLNRALSKASAQVTGFGAKAQAVGAKLKSVGSTMTRGLTLPILGAGIAAGKLALDFNTAMTHVQALTGASRKQTQEWSDAILKLGPKIGQTPQQLANALYFVASSGAKVNQVLPITVASAKAAAAGMGDAQTVAQLLTSAMNAYGPSVLSATQATDALTEAVKLGKAEPGQLAQEMGKVIPMAQNLGVSFQEAAGLMAELTNTGLDAAESATAIRQAMASLVKPSADAQKALKSIGLTAGELQQEIGKRGLDATLLDLVKRFHGNREAIARVFPNIRALTGVLALTGKNAGNVQEALKKMGESSGAAAQAFAIARRSPGFQLRQDLAELEAVAIKLGNILIPIFTRVAARVASLAQAFSTLSPAAQNMILIGAGILAVLGPLTTVTGTLIGVVRGLALAYQVLTGAELAADAAAAGWVAVIGVVVVALAAVALGLVIAYKRSATFRAVVHEAMNGARVAVGWVVDAFHHLMNVAGSVIGFIREHWRGLLLLIGGPWGALALVVIGHWRDIQRVAGAAIGFIRDHWKTLIAAIPVIGPIISIVAKHFGTFKSIAGGALRVVWSILKAIASALRTIVSWADKVASALEHIHVPHIPGSGILGSIVGGAKGLVGGVTTLGGATGSVTVHTPIYLDGRQVGIALAKANVDFRRQNGRGFFD